MVVRRPQASKEWGIHMHTCTHAHESPHSHSFSADTAGGQWEQHQNPNSSVTQIGAWAQGPTPTRCVFAPLSICPALKPQENPERQGGMGI